MIKWDSKWILACACVCWCMRFLCDCCCRLNVKCLLEQSFLNIACTKKYLLYVCLFVGNPWFAWSAGPTRIDWIQRSQRRTGTVCVCVKCGYCLAIGAFSEPGVFVWLCNHYCRERVLRVNQAPQDRLETLVIGYKTLTYISAHFYCLSPFFFY